MKKIIYTIFAILTLFCLSGCNNKNGTEKDTITIVATIFPEYDWVMNILGENPANAEVILLLDNGADLHNYQLTTADMLTIKDSDLFIYVGGESDDWVNDVLKTLSADELNTVNLMDILGDSKKIEEEKEGMQSAFKNGSVAEYDEHAWLSLKNAQLFTRAIRDTLCKIDPDNSSVYTENSKNYIEKLNELDSEYTQSLTTAKNNTLLFADRFPFRYLTDDYGLDYYAAFKGCSAETEASFETIKFLADKTDELQLAYILMTESSDGKIAQTIIGTSDSKSAKILSLDSMQSTTLNDYKNGVTYLSVMEKNLEILKTVLNRE